MYGVMHVRGEGAVRLLCLGLLLLLYLPCKPRGTLARRATIFSLIYPHLCRLEDAYDRHDVNTICDGTSKKVSYVYMPLTLLRLKKSDLHSVCRAATCRPYTEARTRYTISIHAYAPHIGELLLHI